MSANPPARWPSCWPNTWTFPKRSRTISWKWGAENSSRAPRRAKTLRIPPFLQAGSRPAGGVQPAEVHFVQRQAELGRLAAFLQQVSGGNGAAVFILGDAGSGKTTLMAEFARWAQEQYPQLLAAAGQCNAQTGAGDPYRPFRDMLGMLTGDLEAGWLAEELTPTQARRIWISVPDTIRVLADFGPNLVNILLPLAPLVKRLTPYLSGPAGWFDHLLAAGRSARPSGLEQHQVLEEVTQVLRQIAARRPLLLLLDDLQWADDASINLLFHLCRRLAGSQILLVGAFDRAKTRQGRARSKPWRWSWRVNTATCRST